mmetsp:Transcript_45081/g.116570  ORF Transcript_45081/g.116570 Transcript_45081/m.116570 type:complete len:84 (+) Transcript_45081:127-378(+)
MGGRGKKVEPVPSGLFRQLGAKRVGVANALLTSAVVVACVFALPFGGEDNVFTQPRKWLDKKLEWSDVDREIEAEERSRSSKK